MSKTSLSRTNSSVTNIHRVPKSIEIFKKEISIDDHLLSINELMKRYQTSAINGLTSEVAAALLVLNGPNALIPPKVKSRWFLLLGYIFGGFSILLWAGAILSVIGFVIAYSRDANTPFDQLYLSVALFIIIHVTGFFGFYQERANQKIMESFNKMVPKTASVTRNGLTMTIASENLVLGDLVEVRIGDCVPADIRIITCDALKVDNSSLTGESEPQFRSADSYDKNPLESPNLMFYGTNVVEGIGRGIVISCGDKTLMGHIAGLTSGLQSDVMLIKKELALFVRIITILSVGIGIVFFIVAVIVGIEFFDAFLYSIAIIVANVPEGLLVTMTACLTLTARRMAKKNCLVKNLQAIETLGATTVICSDKTGTLTQNKMSVLHFYFDNITFSISERSYKPKIGFRALSNVLMLCNRAVFAKGQEDIKINDRKTMGDSSESAILKAMEKVNANVTQYRAQYPKVFEVPFNSSNKYQLSIHVVNGGHTIVMKGAPEKIVSLCQTIQMNGNTLPLTASLHSNIKKTMEELANYGERVIGCADMELSSAYPLGFQFKNIKNNYNFPHNNFRFVGLVSMMDPPRPGVLEAVIKCKTAGIRVIMVTGDHPITGMSIARKCGILSPEKETIYDIALKRNISVHDVRPEEIPDNDAHVVTGTMLREMSLEELDEITSNYAELVFARTSPQQKLMIVESFQRNKEIVAVTGDGVNDSPALKKANIGIAMGISGSEVSKEAADMILLDDNFATIVTGIEEGRLIFDNLKKSIAYMLTSNLPEMVPFIMFVLVSMPNALSIMAILVIDIGTDLWPGISLAYEKPEADIMLRMPRNPQRDKLVNMRLICFTYLNIGVIQSCAGFSCYYVTMALYGFMPGALFGIRKTWESPSMIVMDYYGREWSYRERMILEKKCFSAYFLAIVITQVADCFICKTRRLSVFTQGCTNWMMNTAIMFEIAIALFVVFCPGLNSVLQFSPINLIFVLPAVPFAIFLFVFDEIRRLILRRNPNGWVERETYF